MTTRGRQSLAVLVRFKRTIPHGRIGSIEEIYDEETKYTFNHHADSFDSFDGSAFSNGGPR